MADTKTAGAGKRSSLEACTNTAVENARELFGEHPEDVISQIDSAAKALGWLQEIFITIKKEADDTRQWHRVEKLAELGEYLALDFANHAGCQYEEYLERLKTAGVVLSGEVSHG